LDFRLTISKPSGADFNITSPTTVRARSLDNGEWSALTEATFTTSDPANDQNLVISEIFYNPVGPTEDGEFIELLNIADSPISLAGVRFDSGIAYQFPATSILAAGERIVLTPAEYTGQLDNGGEDLRLTANDGSPIRSYRYDDNAPWPENADGDGHSLVLANPQANPDHGLPENWLPSATSGGSPGSSDTVTPSQGVDLIEFFLGGAPIEVLIIDGQATIRVPRILSAGGASITIETSENFHDWSVGNTTFEGHESRSEDASTMVWSLPRTASDLFARARITLVP